MNVQFTFSLEVDAEVQEDGSVRVLGIRAPQPLPLAVTNLRALDVTETDVELAWDNLGDASSWNIYRDDVLLTNVSLPTHIDSTVAAGVSYVYTVKGVNATGEGDASNELNITTDDPAGLASPTGLTNDLLTANVVSLSWDNPGNVIEWDVRRDAVVIATVTQPGYDDTTVTGGNSYDYDVIARLSGGDSAPCTAITVVTPANIAPQWQLVDDQVFDVSVGDNFSLDLESVCVDPDNNPMTFTLVSGGPPGIALNGTILNGSFSTAGSYAACLLRADDGTDTSDVTVDFEVAALPDTTAPTAPVLATPVVTGSTVSIDLDTPATDASGIAFYRILRKGPGEGSHSIRADIQESEFPYVESGLAAGNWDYKCKAFDLSPNSTSQPSANSPSVIATVAAVNPNPDTPINFAALVNDDVVDLSWAPGPSGATVTGYDLEFSIEDDGGSDTGPWTDFVVGGTATSAIHSALPTGKVWYRIRALSATGASGYTSVLTVTIGNSLPAANFVIATTDGDWNGSANHTPVGGGTARPVRPGDVIELEAGTHRFRVISKLIGTSTNPVILRGPATGQAIIRKANSASSVTGGFGINLQGCRWGVFDCFTTDSGAPVEADGKRHSVKFTYKANATNTNRDTVVSWIKFSGSSASGSAPYDVTRDWTVRYAHIDGGWSEVAGSTLSNTSGIGISTNDHGYHLNNFPGQWQENIIIEHLLVENTGGEGHYVGPNPFEAPNPDVPLRYIKTRYCMFKNTGGNGASYKSVFGGEPGGDEATSNSVHDCIFIKCGRDAGANGTVAFTANSSRTAIYNCWFEDCGFGAFNFNASEGTDYNFPGPDPTMRGMAFNNVILRCAALGDQPAINCLKHSSVPASFAFRLRIFCNTIIDHGGGGEIKMSNANGAEGFVRNNWCPGGTITYGPYANPGTNVLTGAAVDSTGTYEGSNLDLSPSSPVTITGTLGSGTPGTWSTSVDVPPFDFFNATRTAPRNAGAIEV